MKNINTVIFDFDGTVVDSVESWSEHINPQFFERYNIFFDHTLGFPKEVSGLNADQVAIYLKEKYEINITPEQFRKDWLCLADKHINQISTLKPSVKDFIQFVSKKNINLSIASNNFKEIIEKCLKINNIYDYFRFILAECDVERLKPHPDIFLNCAKKLGVEPKHCLVFEDSLTGMIAAKRAGMYVCGVYDKHSNNIDDIKQNCDEYILNYNDAIDLFNDKMIV